MKRLVSSTLAVLLAAAGLTVQLGGGTATAQSAPPVVRVMPLGDSITAGAGSSTGAGYRLPLWNLVAGQSRYTVDFVGSQQSGGAVLSDPDNEGHSGYMINDISGGVDSWIAAQHPDVILLHIGINDLDRSLDKAHAGDRLKSLVDQIFTDKPGVTVIVQGLIPTTSGLQDLVQQYNDQARLLAPAEQQQGRRFSYVDAPALTSAEFADRLHPNDLGHARLASAFYAPLDQAFTDGWATGGAPLPGGSAPEVSSKVRWVDFNGDGKADYVYLNDDGSVHVFLNEGGDGHGGWLDYGQVATGLTTDRSRVRFADFDGDGKADYILINPDGSIRVFLNKGGDGHGGWQDLGIVATGLTNNADQVRFTDFTGSGKADYTVINNDGSVHVFANNGGDGRGGWQDLGIVATGLTTDRSRVRFADFTGSGKADYILINPDGSVHVFLNKGGDGRGGWEDYGQVATGLTTNQDQVRFADFNGDGKADYILMNTDGSVHTVLSAGGDGHGGWTDLGQVATGVVTE